MKDKIKERIENVTIHGWNKLDLRNCGLKTIPQEIFQNCMNVSIIDLGNDSYCLSEDRNTIEVLPEKISELKKLTRLNISNNKISEITEALGNLQNLRYLNLSNNDIKHLPPQIANLPKLEELILEGNPLDFLPPEIVARGRDSIRNFIKELDKSDFLYEAKLIIVGEGRVGKTCISKALIDPEYVLGDEVSTDGINIQTWTVNYDLISVINPTIKRDLTINVWDFGGQEIYHSTHQFFLTKRAIYLIVTESRKEDRHEDFYYWLNIIKILGDQSPVVMVLNKCDQPSKEIPFKEFQESFSNLKNFYRVSLKQGHKDSFYDFRKELIEITSKLPHMGTALPKVWVDIRIELERLKDSGLNYISENEYLQICKTHYRDFDGAMFLSEYFHDLGVILHFRDDLELKDTIFLNHEWITKGVYKILDDRNVADHRGRFTLEDIKRIWHEEEYRQKMGQLLFLMKNKKFDLCFELENGDFIVPRLLPVDEVETEWPVADLTTQFEIRYKFMPKGILSRLIVKMHQDIYEDRYWRYGVYLKYDDTEALVRERYFESKITISLHGDNRKEFLAIIRKHILQINKDFKRLKYEEMIQCICEECRVAKTPYFHSYDLLRRCEQKGIPTLLCSHSLTQVSVPALLSDISGTRVSKEKLIYCENQNAELLNLLDIQNVSFISEKDSAGVFSHMKSSPDKYGLRDRDFLLDSEIERLQKRYPHYYVLRYYCFENYLYHPANMLELNINNLGIDDYKQELIEQKNAKKDIIISNFKQSRRTYFELKVDSEGIMDKGNENDIIKYLSSDDVEIFFKAFSVKEYFNKNFISKYDIKQQELASTEWFKARMLEIIDPAN